MVLNNRDVWQSWTFVARRYGFETKRASRSAIAAALQKARKLAVVPELAPAAVFFALARRPSAFPGGPARGRVLHVMVAAQARRLGLDMQVSPQRFVQTMLRVQGKLGKRWVFERLAYEVETWLVGF